MEKHPKPDGLPHSMKIFKTRIPAILSTLFLLFMVRAYADTILLKNGKSLEGVITKEGEGTVEIDVGGGTVGFSQGEINRIQRSTPEENAEIRNGWELSKARSEETKAQDMAAKAEASKKWEQLVTEQMRDGRERRGMDEKTKIVQAGLDNGHIRVHAVLNEKVPALLIVDTGCPVVLLSAHMAGELGIDLESAPNAPTITVLNGKHKVKQVLLKSVKLGDLEEKDVTAEVLVEDDPEIREQLKDGLLGMSFLRRFNVTFDQKKMKLIFKPRS